MRTQFIAALLTASVAWMPPSSAAAQQITERQAAFESLADSQWIRLKVPHVAGRYEGRLLQRGPDHLVLSAEPEPLRIAATTIDTLWTRGNAGMTGAIVGGLVLGTLGAALGAAWAEESTEHDVASRRGHALSPEGLDWLGARYSGASSGSPYLNGTASTPSHWRRHARSEAGAPDTGRQTSKEGSLVAVRPDRPCSGLAGRVRRAQQSSRDQVEVRVVNSTGLSNLVITVSTAGQSVYPDLRHERVGPPRIAPTGVETAGEPVQFHVEVGDETADHTCHVHARRRSGNRDNVPTAVDLQRAAPGSVPERVAGGRDGVLDRRS